MILNTVTKFGYSYKRYVNNYVCVKQILTNVLQVRVITLHRVQTNQELSSVTVMLDFLEMDLLALVCNKIYQNFVPTPFFIK